MALEVCVGDGRMSNGGGSRFRLFSATLAVALLAIGLGATSALALSPAVETRPASGLTETGATLNGIVNPNGLETKMYFEYGTTTSYGTKTSEVSVGSGSSPLEKGQSIGSLTKNTTYHYRIVAGNSSGTSYGVDQEFTTVGPPEALTIGPEYFASGEEATLRAYIFPHGQATTYQFTWGAVGSGTTSKAPASPESAGSGYGANLVTTKITGLTPGTEYRYWVVATNPSGTFVGNEITFLSSKAPAVEMLPASGIWRTKSTLEAKVKPHELATTYYFEYGTTVAYGSKTTSKEISKETATATVAELVSGLKENTEYHYRLVASNSAGTTYGKDQTFTTLASVTLYASGVEMKKPNPLKAFSSNLAIQGRSCSEAEISGEVEEHPGAREIVTGIKWQSGAVGCAWKPESSLTMKYRKGANIKETHAVEYAKKGSEVLVRTTPEFRVIGEAFLGGGKVAECEYNIALTGSGSTGKALAPTLSGKTEMLKGSIYCPFGGETVSGTFAFTSEGKTVEAK